jgi:threonine dehydrogenase-like Zn-dependent dehydrogenase
MRGLIFDGTSIRLETTLAAPKPSAGEAIVRLRRAAISPFDMLAARGGTSFRGVLGHQFVGIVESVHGDGAASRKLVNQRVTASLVSSCGECDLCRKGLGVHCRKRTLMGMCERDGCLAERFCLPVKHLVNIPSSVDDDRAVFAADVAAALHAAQQLTIVNRPYVTILGDSSLALIMAQVMSKMNATVRIVGASAAKLELCAKWSVKHRLLDDVGMRNDQDIVIDCADASIDGLTTALGMVRPRGKIVLKCSEGAASRPASSPSAMLSAIIRHEIEVIGSFVGSTAEGLAALERNEVDVLSLISRRFALREGVAAMKSASQPDAIKVVLTSDE